MLVVYTAITWSLLGTATGLTGLVALVFGLTLIVLVAYMTVLSALGAYVGDRIVADRTTA